MLTIVLGLVLMVSGFITFIFGVNESSKPAPIIPVAVGEEWLSNDPFEQSHPRLVMEVSGDYVKFRMPGDAPNVFRSTTQTNFKAWYPNRYIKSSAP